MYKDSTEYFVSFQYLKLVFSSHFINLTYLCYYYYCRQFLLLIYYLFLDELCHNMMKFTSFKEFVQNYHLYYPNTYMIICERGQMSNCGKTLTILRKFSFLKELILCSRRPIQKCLIKKQVSLLRDFHLDRKYYCKIRTVNKMLHLYYCVKQTPIMTLNKGHALGMAIQITVISRDFSSNAKILWNISCEVYFNVYFNEQINLYYTAIQ